MPQYFSRFFATSIGSGFIANIKIKIGNKKKGTKPHILVNSSYSSKFKSVRQISKTKKLMQSKLTSEINNGVRKAPNTEKVKTVPIPEALSLTGYISPAATLN